MKSGASLFFGIISLIFYRSIRANSYIPIFGNTTLGYYYVEAYIGTPPQKQSLILDTGSHLTIFPCKGCTHCKTDHLFSIFNQGLSSTFEWIDPIKSYFNWQCSNPNKNKKCPFQQGYTEGSVYKGFFAIDNFAFENELSLDQQHNHKHIFGCAMVETNEFYRQKSDGILGIGVLTRFAYRNPPTIIDTELVEGRIDKHSFSLCLGHNGGVMSLGSMNSKLHVLNSPIINLDCSLMKWDDQYNVNLTAILAV